MSSKKVEERNEKIIRGLMKLPPNRRCINCNSLGPQYVCTNFWTFVCMTCSGIHREFTHRVKSVSMSKFTSQEVESLQEGGNQRARETFLKDWDPREQRLPDNSNVDKVRDFIKSVYVDKKFSASKASGKPPRDTLSLRNHEDETRRASSYHSYSQSPPYDYQYEERRYGKQAPALTKKPGSDRGMVRFMSTSRLSDHVQEDRFANEVANARVSDYSGNNGGDLFRSDTQSPPSLSHSSGSGKFDSELFSVPNAPQPTTFAPSAETGKFDSLDLFSAPNAPQRTTSAPSSESGKFDGLDLFSGPNAPQPTISASSAETGKFGGLDLFSAPTAPQRTTSAPSAETGKFDGLDLFSGPNAPQPTTSAPSAETKKFDSLDLFTATNAPHSTTPSFPVIDLFDLSATSSASAAPTLNVNPQFQAFEPSLHLFSVMPQQQSSESLMAKKSDGWASFDMPWHAQPSQPDFNGSGPFGAPVNEKNNQSWSSFDETSKSFENIYTESNEQDHVVSDPYLAWGVSENLKMKQADFDARPTPFLTPTPHAIDGTQSYGLDTKSRNPFDFPDDGELESSDMFFDMSSMQTSLPNHNMSTPWFPDAAAIPYTPDALVYMAGQTSNMQIPNVQAQGPVASVGGNPFG